MTQINEKSNSNLKSIERLKFGKWYQSGLIVSADWIAGGNFEGQISRNYLKFIENTNIVEFRSDLLAKRFETPKTGKIVYGKYYGNNDKGALDVIFENFRMLGFVLGLNNEYIAFDAKYENLKYRKTIGYELLNS
jgi:hypothetical protein